MTRQFWLMENHRYTIPRVPLVWWYIDGARTWRAEYPCQLRTWRAGNYAGVKAMQWRNKRDAWALLTAFRRIRRTPTATRPDGR